MLYLDTSLIVGTLTTEPRSTAIDAWLAAQDPGKLVISDWVVTEFSSALSIKVRTGAIDAMQRAAMLAQFKQLVVDTFAILPIKPSAFAIAARFCDQSSLNLRAGDALHLAICAEHGATICTLDQTLSRAAPLVGVACVAV
jgi:uncharacterized protein